MGDELKILLSVAAVVVAASWPTFWPLIKAGMTGNFDPLIDGKPSPSPVPPVAPAPPAAVLDAATFAEAIECLAVVRTRLVKTACLDDAGSSAVEALTLALVRGSDQ